MGLILSRVNDRVRKVERQTNPASQSGRFLPALVDAQSTGIYYRQLEQASAPTGLAQSDTGTEWVNSSTGVIQWWDGFAWHTGEYPYQNDGDIASFFGAPGANAGRQNFKVTSSTSTPGSPALGDLWFNPTGSVWKQYQGSSFVTITDTIAIAALTTAKARTGVNTFLVWVQSFTPSGTDGDYWTDTDNYNQFVYALTKWSHVPVPADPDPGIVLTANTFQTAEYGQRMEMSSDVSGGVLKFWTGDSTETAAGYINPLVDSVPALEIASPSTGASTRVLIQLFSGIGLDISYAGNDLVLDVSGFNVTNCDSFFKNLTTSAFIIAGGSLTGNKLFASSPDTSTGSVNIKWNASNQVCVLSSLSRYKIDQQVIDLETVEKLLNLDPKTWYDRTEFEENGDSAEGLHRIPGLIAEEVEAIAPEFATYDVDDNLQGVAYDRVGVAWIPLVRDLYAKLEEKDRRIDLLEQRLGSLERAAL